MRMRKPVIYGDISAMKLYVIGAKLTPLNFMNIQQTGLCAVSVTVMDGHASAISAWPPL